MRRFSFFGRSVRSKPCALSRLSAAWLTTTLCAVSAWAEVGSPGELAESLRADTVTVEERATARPPAQSSWNLGFAVLVEPPLDVGLRLKLELPGRVFLASTLGYMPSTFARGINATVIAFGGYDETTGNLVRSGLSSSLFFRAQVGWRPIPGSGFYLAAGYGLVTLGGGVSGEAILAALGNQPIPAGELDIVRSYKLSSTLHMINAEAGWRWLAWDDRFEIGLSLGFAGTLGASTSVTPVFTPRNPAAVHQFAAVAGAYLDALYKTYVFTPVVSVSFGYRFF